MITRTSLNGVATVRVIRMVWIAFSFSWPPRASTWRATSSSTVCA
jgi:hypothetical protein